MIYEKPRFLPGGDRAVFVEFGDTIDPELNHLVRRLMLTIQKAKLPELVEIVPTYRSLLVHYDPRLIRPEKMRAKLEILAEKTDAGEFPAPKVTEIPTAYGDEYGHDLDFVAKYSGLSSEEVIRLHASKAYLIYMLGFIPGFAYLGRVPPRIATPRLPTPRAKILAGSVGIAGNQTGIYPAESPGGWQLIGRTPIELFCPDKEPPALLQMGNYVKFVQINAEEFNSIREKVVRGTYRVKETSLMRENDGGGI
jgi:inhibitor of KinA